MVWLNAEGLFTCMCGMSGEASLAINIFRQYRVLINIVSSTGADIPGCTNPILASSKEIPVHNEGTSVRHRDWPKFATISPPHKATSELARSESGMLSAIGSFRATLIRVRWSVGKFVWALFMTVSTSNFGFPSNVHGPLHSIARNIRLLQSPGDYLL